MTLVTAGNTSLIRHSIDSESVGQKINSENLSLLLLLEYSVESVLLLLNTHKNHLLIIFLGGAVGNSKGKKLKMVFVKEYMIEHDVDMLKELS